MTAICKVVGDKSPEGNDATNIRLDNNITPVDARGLSVLIIGEGSIHIQKQCCKFRIRSYKTENIGAHFITVAGQDVFLVSTVLYTLWYNLEDIRFVLLISFSCQILIYKKRKSK